MKDVKGVKDMKKTFMFFMLFMSFTNQNLTRMPAVTGIAHRALESWMVSRPDPIS